MKKRSKHKKKRSLKSFILLLFYVNIAIYIGGEISWDLFDKSQPTQSSTSAKIDEDSNYGRIITKYSQRNGLDWRFVASMIQAESSFRPDAVSPVGAVGLMQVLPWIAHAEGVTNIKDPEENVRFGVKHFTRNFNRLKGETLEDTMKMNLAAYNAGATHIYDAKRLATYLGMNPMKWSSLEKTLPLLEQKGFHRFAKAGYCQGRGIVAYVNKVFKTYNQYREKHPDYPVIPETTVADASF